MRTTHPQADQQGQRDEGRSGVVFEFGHRRRRRWYSDWCCWVLSQKHKPRNERDHTQEPNYPAKLLRPQLLSHSPPRRHCELHISPFFSVLRTGAIGICRVQFQPISRLSLRFLPICQALRQLGRLLRFDLSCGNPEVNLSPAVHDRGQATTARSHADSLRQECRSGLAKPIFQCLVGLELHYLNAVDGRSRFAHLANLFFGHLLHP